MKRDQELIRLLLHHWYATRAWAEEFLCRSLGLGTVKDVLKLPGAGRVWPIPGSNFTYRRHGLGVDVDRGFGCGGIDFDFDQFIPDAYRLHDFCKKQFNTGNLDGEFRSLIDDDDRFFAAVLAVTGGAPHDEGLDDRPLSSDNG
jgi:hypothetical protein